MKWLDYWFFDAFERWLELLPTWHGWHWGVDLVAIGYVLVLLASFEISRILYKRLRDANSSQSKPKSCARCEGIGQPRWIHIELADPEVLEGLDPWIQQNR